MKIGLTNREPAALCLSFEVCKALCEAVPRARTLDEALHAIDAVRADALGPGLLTVNLRCDAVSWPLPSHRPQQHEADPATTIELQRLWSSDTTAYPVAGRKRKARTAWTRQLFERGEVFIGEGAPALAEVFDDHERIASLGLQAIVNVPLRDVRRVGPFASFNVLTPRDHWLPQEIWLIRLLASIAMPAVARESQLARP